MRLYRASPEQAQKRISDGYYFMDNKDQDLIGEIESLKKERGAVILAHNYQLAEVQDAADFTGDSLELSRKAAETDAGVIVFCGVHFMAETAKILSPDRPVLIPDPESGCPMADMVDVDQLGEFKALHPGVPVVAYVNTSAAVKAESDICCTSANAVNVVNSVDSDTVLFLPDASLAAHTAAHTTKRVIPYPGFCPTHHRILASDVQHAKREHPEAVVVSHPECTMDVLALADAIESTSGMLRFVKSSDADEFVICTERGLLHKLQAENPQKTFYNPNPENICPNMKKITLRKLRDGLKEMQYEIVLADDVIKAARSAIEGMIAL